MLQLKLLGHPIPEEETLGDPELLLTVRITPYDSVLWVALLVISTQSILNPLAHMTHGTQQPAVIVISTQSILNPLAHMTHGTQQPAVIVSNGLASLAMSMHELYPSDSMHMICMTLDRRTCYCCRYKQ